MGIHTYIYHERDVRPDNYETDNGKSQGGSSSDDASDSNTPASEPVQEGIEAGIAYAEARGNDCYIEVQVVDANVGRTKRIEFYSAKKQEKYGVVGIRLELI